jgi:hypothetical protein
MKIFNSVLALIPDEELKIPYERLAREFGFVDGQPPKQQLYVKMKEGTTVERRQEVRFGIQQFSKDESIVVMEKEAAEKAIDQISLGINAFMIIICCLL